MKEERADIICIKCFREAKPLTGCFQVSKTMHFDNFLCCITDFTLQSTVKVQFTGWKKGTCQIYLIDSEEERTFLFCWIFINLHKTSACLQSIFIQKRSF